MEGLINGRFQILRELGKGGMGTVYLVADLHHGGSLLALKKIRSEAASEDFLARFRVEFSELAKLHHPNLASARDFGRIAETQEYFFTTEYVRGIDVFRGTEGASFNHLANVAAQLLSGLDFIHSHGFLHNDLKPTNVLLERWAVTPGPKEPDGLRRLEAAIFGASSRVRIIDFGLLSAENTASPGLLGTPGYISPERIRCEPADRRSDLYSLGCVLFLLFAREPPLYSPDAKEVLRLHQEVPAPSLAEFCPDLPPVAAEIVDRLLAKDPRDRFPGAGAALRLLGDALGWGKDLPAPRAKSPRVEPGHLYHREREIEVLEQSFQYLGKTSPYPPCVSVEGPAGAGKTRLVRELRGLVQVSGGAYIEVSGHDVEGHLGPIFEAVVRGLETSGVPGHAEARSSLRRIQENPLGERGSAYELEEVIFHHASRMPLVVHFDDFQSASETVRRFALELVHSVCQRWWAGADGEARLMVVLCRRPEGSAGDLRVSGLARIQLEPFSDAVAAEFCRKIFSQDDIPAAVLSSLARLTQGNPGLLVELAKHLVDEGHVKYSGARWVFPPSLSEVGLPETLAGKLHERLSGIQGDSLAILQWLSLCTGGASRSVLSRCLPLKEADIGRLMELLVEQGILAATTDGRVRRYGFAHRKSKESVAARIRKTDKPFMHQRLAQSFEEERLLQTDSVDPGGDSEVLAHHWLQAGNLRGFLRHAAAAAASLQNGGNFALSTEYHQRIVEAMPAEALARKIQSLLQLSEMHEFLWDLEGGRRDLEQILRLGGSIIRPEDMIHLNRRLAGMHIAQHQHQEAVKLLAESRRHLPSPADPLLDLALDAPEAWARWWTGDHEKALELLERAESAAGRAELSSPSRKLLLVSCRAHLANLYAHFGRLRDAAEAQELNLELLSGLNCPQAEAATRCSRGSLLLELGRHEESLADLEAALESARKIADLRTICKARERLGEHHLRAGDPRAALQVTQVGLQDAEATRHPVAAANNFRTLGKVYLRAGEHEEAARAFSTALAIHLECGDQQEAPISRIWLARLHLETNDAEKAAPQIDAAREEARRHESALAEALCDLLDAQARRLVETVWDEGAIFEVMGRLEGYGYLSESCEAGLLLCRARHEARDSRGLLEALTWLESALEGSGLAAHRTRAGYWRALYHALCGETEAAARQLSMVRQTARQLALPCLEAECRESLARITEQLCLDPRR